MRSLELFHFLRPWALLMVPVVIAIWWLVRRRDSAQSQAGVEFAPHLRDALTVNRQSTSRIRPIDATSLAMLLASLAVAGPTWDQEPSPWFSETAPLVVAIEVSDSMRSNDTPPTRLDRARFKVLDLIKERTGSRTAIIAYAGSAHIVMPPTTDIEVVKPFLESLDPAIMPEPGVNASRVLPLANKLLGEEAAIGTLLFVNDGFESTDVPAFTEYAATPGNAHLTALVVGTQEGGVALMPDGTAVMADGGGRLDTSVDTDLVDRISDAADMPIVRMDNDASDIRRLLRVIESNLQISADPNAQWLDRAWWLIWPAAFLALLWFRKGWTMQW